VTEHITIKCYFRKVPGVRGLLLRLHDVIASPTESFRKISWYACRFYGTRLVTSQIFTQLVQRVLNNAFNKTVLLNLAVTEWLGRLEHQSTESRGKKKHRNWCRESNPSQSLQDKPFFTLNLFYMNAKTYPNNTHYKNTRNYSNRVADSQFAAAINCLHSIPCSTTICFVSGMHGNR
jgi:hypothetical protein